MALPTSASIISKRQIDLTIQLSGYCICGNKCFPNQFTPKKIAGTQFSEIKKKTPVTFGTGKFLAK
jgi:hypothetical protein